jgi:hypothetical protein
VLRESGVPALEFRASIVVGDGSLSFELIRSLVDGSPALVLPSWVDTACQPIALDDVVAYLRAAHDVELDESRVVEIGGADTTTYRALIEAYAEARGIPAAVATVPVPSLPFSSGDVPGLDRLLPETCARRSSWSRACASTRRCRRPKRAACSPRSSPSASPRRSRQPVSELELRDHWRATAPNWQHGSARLAWHLVLGDDPELAALADELAAPLAAAGLDPVPAPWLHLTLADASPEFPVLAELAPFALRLGPPGALATAAILPAEPAEELNALRSALGDETPFEPHVTLAYANARTDADALERVLDHCGDRVIETVVDHVALLRLHRRDHSYEWDVLERVPLGG